MCKYTPSNKQNIVPLVSDIVLSINYFVLRLLHSTLRKSYVVLTKPYLLSRTLFVLLFTLFCFATNAQFTSTFTPVNPYCIGSSNGSITLTASTGVASYTVQMTSPSIGSVIAMSGSPASYTFTGLAAGTYSFRIVDAAGSLVNRTVTLSNPSPFSFTARNGYNVLETPYCDSIDVRLAGFYNNGGTARPGYKFEFWVNSGTATGSPTATYNSPVFNSSVNFRLPTPNQDALTAVRVTDSCGNVFTTTFTFATFNAPVTQSATVCGKADINLTYWGLKAPVTFTVDSAGITIRTMVQSTAVSAVSGYSGGTFIGLSNSNYTIKAVDACGRTFTKVVSLTVPTKSIPSAAASIFCGQSSVDSTASFRISTGSWSFPATFTIVSGPSTYSHTNIAGVIDPNITYPKSKTLNSTADLLELSNMPMGTYRLAVLDNCGWTDTVTYVVDASNIVKINISATVTPGCLDANTVTVSGNFSCYRPETLLQLKNSAGTVVGSTGITANPISFSVFNLPSGSYTMNLVGVSTIDFTATNGFSILTHLAAGRPSMIIPLNFANYTGPAFVNGGVLAAPCPNTGFGGTIVTNISGVPPYSYELLNASTNAVVRASQATDTCINLPTGVTYKYRVTDACGNIVISNNIVLNPLTFTLGATTTKSCVPIGGAVTLSADTINATIYNWSGPNGFTATGRIITINSFTNAMSGTYTVTATTLGNCVNTATVVVNALPAIAAITGTTSVCVGATTTLANATSGGVWKSVTPTIATISATGVVTGVAAGTSVIRYTVANASGCIDSVSTTVTISSLPTVAAITGTAVIFVTGTTNLSNATTGGAWSSSNTSLATISATGVVTGIVSGTATISYRVTNANSCSNTATYSVRINPRCNP